MAAGRADRQEPTRRCLATGQVRPRAALLRFVVGPDGAIVADVAGRLPGRGLWLTPRRDIVEQAVAKRLFARAARRPVAVPPGLADRIEALLAERCRELIGLARRAGGAVGGFEKVREAVAGGQVGFLLFALDGAPDARRKLGALGRGLSLARVLTAAELGAAFGRDHVVHAALRSGPLGARILAEAVRIAGFRAEAGVEPALPSAPMQPALLRAHAPRGEQDHGIGVK
ncbi:MAG: RNA-binding protein [Stellaceae bacterium]